MSPTLNAAQSENIKQPVQQNLKQLLDEVARKTTDDNINLPSRFDFTWHNIHFAGQILRAQEAGKFSINLAANLGHIPFSAEDKVRRKKLFATFTPLFLKGEYMLSAQSQIQMILMTDFTGPMNAKRLVEAITYTLLDLREDLKTIQASILE